MKKIEHKNVEEYLSILWKNLQSQGISGEKLSLQNILISKYSEKHRAYHNTNHILTMLFEFEKVKSFLVDPVAVETAIWFHDVVYDTHSTNNEKQSTEVFEKTAKQLGLSNKFTTKVKNLILATKHNTILTDNDAQFLADIDLTALGKLEKDFKKDGIKIRKEYSWVPENRFVSERIKLLQSFLNRPTIFYTHFFQEKYEHVAQKNLKQAIKILQFSEGKDSKRS